MSYLKLLPTTPKKNNPEAPGRHILPYTSLQVAATATSCPGTPVSAGPCASCHPTRNAAPLCARVNFSYFRSQLQCHLPEKPCLKDLSPLSLVIIVPLKRLSQSETRRPAQPMTTPCLKAAQLRCAPPSDSILTQSAGDSVGQRQTARADSSVPQDRPHLGGQSQVLVVTCTSDQLAVNQRVPSLGLINEVEQLRNWGNPLTHQAAILSQRMLEEGMTQKPGEEVHRARSQTKELLSPA